MSGIKVKTAIIGILIVLCIAFSSKPVIANTSANIDGDGGGGPTSTGTPQNNSMNGDYGIRFSVVNSKTGKAITHSVDYYKLSYNKNIGVHHSKYFFNKLDYLKYDKRFDIRRDKYNSKSGGYAYYEPNLWNVIDSRFGKRAGKKRIVSWIDGGKQLKQLASRMNISKAELTSVDNLIIIEPILYFTMEGKYYGLTAHEIALLDQRTSGLVRSKHSSRSHKNIPLSLFLNRPAFGITKYHGRVGVCSNQTIISKLGIGIIGRIPPPEKKEMDMEGFDYTYRCDTDVYTTVKVKPGFDATPDSPIKVTFDIPGVGEHHVDEVYCPAGYEQQVWLKWRTPSVPQKLEIKVSSNVGADRIIKVDIQDKALWEPENPQADDVKPGSSEDFKMNFDPKLSPYIGLNSVTEHSWSRWEDLEYQPRGDFLQWEEIRHYTTGKKGEQIYSHSTYVDIWDNDAYWAFGRHSYGQATAPDGSTVSYIINGRTPGKPNVYKVKIKQLNMQLMPAETSRPANNKNDRIKSGYGIEADIISVISGNGISDITGFQSSKYFFPEFNYKKYWRWGDNLEKKTAHGSLTEKHSLPRNWYSYTGFYGHSKGRYHFLPIWYPDGNYRVCANISDCWTPSGELRAVVEQSIVCKGSMWEDWHIKID